MTCDEAEILLHALMDGELDPRNADRIVQTCCKSGEHKDTWNVYHAVGEAIRDHAELAVIPH